MTTAQPWPPIRCRRCNRIVSRGYDRYLCDCGWELCVREGVGAWGTDAPVGSSYPAHAARAQADWEASHFWPRGRAQLLAETIAARVAPDSPARRARFLDVGCGTGTVLARIAARGLDVVGSDAFRTNLDIARETVSTAALFQADGANMAAPDWFDAAGLFDVIEHIDDEQPILTTCRQVVRQSGLLFVTVPAFQWLYGQRDRIAGHRRRYRADMLRACLERAGWKVESITYFSTILFPLFAAARIVERLRPGPEPEAAAGTDLAETKAGGAMNSVGMWTFTIERRWLQRHSLPFGSSLLAVARRP